MKDIEFNNEEDFEAFLKVDKVADWLLYNSEHLKNLAWEQATDLFYNNRKEFNRIYKTLKQRYEKKHEKVVQISS